MKKSGTYMLALVALLVIAAMPAFGVLPNNGTLVPEIETKTIVEEEVTVYGGEILAVIAVDPGSLSGASSMEIAIDAATAEYKSPTVAGGIPVLPGGL